MIRRRGFTLVELMVVIVILAILMSMAAPALRSFVVGQRVKSLALDLTSDLLFARSEALKRGASVTMTPRSDGWVAGWTVSATLGDGTALVSREGSPDAILFDNAPTDGITFNANGRVSSSATALNITVRSTASPSQDRCVQLDVSGRARVNPGACP